MMRSEEILTEKDFKHNWINYLDTAPSIDHVGGEDLVIELVHPKSKPFETLTIEGTRAIGKTTMAYNWVKSYLETNPSASVLWLSSHGNVPQKYLPRGVTFRRLYEAPQSYRGIIYDAVVVDDANDLEEIPETTLIASLKLGGILLRVFEKE